MNMMTEIPLTAALSDLVKSLEQATHMSKQLPNTTDPSQLLHIYTTLHSAHHHLSSFLSLPTPPSIPTPPPPSQQPQTTTAENSVSSAVGGGDEYTTGPMEVGDGDNDDDDEVEMVERVEERMRDCFIRNKRAKRQLSPAALAAEQEGRRCQSELVKGFEEFGILRNKLRSLDLIYQFHG